MSQDDWDSPEHQTLYHIPIETLGLSESTLKPLKRTGVETVGDCADFIQRITDGNVLGAVPRGFNEAAFNEVKSQLEASGGQ